MKTQAECFNVLFVVLLVGAFLALPSSVHSEPMSSGDLQSAQERIRLLVSKPIELATATKEAVRSLDPENRKSLRSSLAQKALVATNFEDRLALLNVVVDATTWTNAAERSLSDSTLASFLKQVYKQDPHTALRDRAAVALLRKTDASAADIEWVADLVRSGRWDALPLAIRWHDRSLGAYVQEMLVSASWPWPTNRTIRVFPSVYVRQDQIEATDFTPLQKMELHNLALAQSVNPADLLVTYLAAVGDEQSLESLRNSYRLAAPPGDDRTPANKDKLYWYALLCLAGELPGPLPAP